ncbi:Scd5 protein [Martiniozyma asiatica (nom. inval.)]|nr:Scd5 protein [Martiniozyma asiatica]
MSAHFDWNKIPGVHTDDDVSHNHNINSSGIKLPHEHIVQFFHPSQSDTAGKANGSHHKLSSNSNIPILPNHLPKISKKIYNKLGFSETFHSSQTDNNHLKSVSNNRTLDTGNEQKDDSTQSLPVYLSNNLNPGHVKPHASSTDSIITKDDNNLSLSLGPEFLTAREKNTYLRWYQNIKGRNIRFQQKNVTLDDVFKFLSNFAIPPTTKERMKILFGKISDSLTICEFYALMRMLAHALAGEPLKSSLINVPIAVPKPLSILAKKRKKIDNSSEEGSPAPGERPKLDINSFTELLLTGQTSARNANSSAQKKVQFSEVVTFSPPPMDPEEYDIKEQQNNHIPISNNVIDYSLPMDQLLEKLKLQNSSQQSQEMVVKPAPSKPSQPTEEEKEVLKDVNIESFKNVTHMDPNSGTVPAPLKPNLTGSASKSMKEHFMKQFDQTFNFNTQPEPNVVGNISLLAAENNAVESNTGLNQNQNSNFSLNQLQTPQLQFSQNSQTLLYRQTLPDNISPQRSHNQSDYFSGYNSAAPIYGSNNSSVTSPLYESNSQIIDSPSWPSDKLVSSMKPPPPAPRPRSSSLQTTSPPPLPPPRLRKTSGASNTSQSLNSLQPVLPPKPVLNDQQKQRYLTSAPQQTQQQQQQQLPQMANIGMNMNNMASMNFMGGNNNGYQFTQQQQPNSIQSQFGNSPQILYQNTSQNSQVQWPSQSQQQQWQGQGQGW